MYKCTIAILLLITFTLLPTDTQSVTVCNGYVPTPKVAHETYHDKVAKMVIVAIENAKQQGLKTPLPSVATAQLLIESRNGKSRLATEAFNFHGIRAKKGEPYILGFDDGKWRRFRRFANMQQSIVAHIKVLNNGRYKAVFAERTPYGQALAIKQAGYATNKAYPKIIANTIRHYKLAKYD